MQLENISKFRNIYFSTQQYICIYNNDQTFAIDYRKRKITTALLLLIGITSIHFSRLKRFHKKEQLPQYCAPKNVVWSYSIQTNYLSWVPGNISQGRNNKYCGPKILCVWSYSNKLSICGVPGKISQGTSNVLATAHQK